MLPNSELSTHFTHFLRKGRQEVEAMQKTNGKLEGTEEAQEKGPKTSRSLLERNLFYLYEGPKDLQKPFRQEFVLPI